MNHIKKYYSNNLSKFHLKLFPDFFILWIVIAFTVLFFHGKANACDKTNEIAENLLALILSADKKLEHGNKASHEASNKLKIEYLKFYDSIKRISEKDALIFCEIIEYYTSNLLAIKIDNVYVEYNDEFNLITEDLIVKNYYIGKLNGFSSSSKNYRILVNIETIDCKKKKLDPGYDVRATPRLMINSDQWKYFSSITNDAKSELTPGQWFVEIKNSPTNWIRRGPYEIGSALQDGSKITLCTDK